MKQKSNIFVNLCCNYWIFKSTQKIRIFDNINKSDFSNTFTSVELNLYHKQFTGYPQARTLPLRQGVQVLTGFWWENPREQDRLEDLGVDGTAILKWIFKKWNGEVWAGLSWLRIRTNVGLL
jgi:hypothetical protein